VTRKVSTLDPYRRCGCIKDGVGVSKAVRSGRNQSYVPVFTGVMALVAPVVTVALGLGENQFSSVGWSVGSAEAGRMDRYHCITGISVVQAAVGARIA